MTNGLKSVKLTAFPPDQNPHRRSGLLISNFYQPFCNRHKKYTPYSGCSANFKCSSDAHARRNSNGDVQMMHIQAMIREKYTVFGQFPHQISPPATTPPDDCRSVSVSQLFHRSHHRLFVRRTGLGPADYEPFRRLGQFVVRLGRKLCSSRGT